MPGPNAIKLGSWSMALPRNRVLRISIGVTLTTFGFLGFLPILGFWMIPLGFLVLSIDIRFVRRGRRRVEVGLGHWMSRKCPSLAKYIGYSGERRARVVHSI